MRNTIILDEKEESFFFNEDTNLNWKKDYPAWKSKDNINENIYIKMILEISSNYDEQIYRFIEEFSLKISERNPDNRTANLCIMLDYPSKENKRKLFIRFNEKDIDDDYQKDEILKRIQSSNCLIFHNSTNNGWGLPFKRKYDPYSSFFNHDDKELIEKQKERLFQTMKNPMKKQEKILSELLGRLDEKYEVGLSFPRLNFEKVPLEISLGEKNMDMPLEDWGSGTRNRTLIFMSLFNAKKLVDSDNNPGKISPIVIIEEPECFLHPSAQAEFGRILQDLSEEFKIQVITTTHSPYLLSFKNPSSNILLKRKDIGKRKYRETELIDTSGENWKEPFELALGITGPEFEAFKNVFFSDSNGILLVEGDTDKEYFELLRQESHGKNKLNFSGDIFSYDGIGNLKNPVLLRFIKERFSKSIITLDLDMAHTLKNTFDMLKFDENKHYFTIGINSPGKKNIEGLLPKAITSKVYHDNPDLVQQQSSNVVTERQEATKRLKKILLEEFKKSALLNEEYYREFYVIVKKINKSLRSHN